MKTLMQIMEMIELQEEVKAIVLKTIQNFNIEEYEEDVFKLMDIHLANDARTRLKEALDVDENNFKILSCMLYSLIYTYEKYKELKISDKIFIDTMKCFTRFISEYHAGNNKWAFDRDWWTYRQISMTIYRIGELEYEMKSSDGVKYISIHIPSDADLKIENVIESLKDSNEFFRDYFPEYYNVEYSCRSWLLSSDLKKLLPENSNILKFQSLFNIISENYSGSGFIKWIYKADYSDLNELPEDTSLQRNLKQYLLAGNSVSVAYGKIKHIV